MQLLPRELDKLILHNAGFVAQKRLARGLRLNVPEAQALIATVTMERARDGAMSVSALMDHGRQLLGKRETMAGVSHMIPSIMVEATFRDGTKMVTVSDPIANEEGNLEAALFGSFLPVPDPSKFDTEWEKDLPIPGEVLTLDGKITLNEGRDSIELEVVNTGDRPIQVGSHCSFIETNRFLEFDRDAAYGYHLDIPAGNAVRFEPGEKKTVTLVPLAGDQITSGGNNLGSGEVNSINREEAKRRVEKYGFANKKS